MPKLTDDQLGDLLRETFADHVDDQASLPIATKRRPLAPVLIAAAAVLTVLAGTVYTVRQSAPEPPAAAPTVMPTADTPADIWAVAIRKIAEAHQPSGGWRKLRIYTMVWRVEGKRAVPVRPNEPMPPPANRMIMQAAPADRDRIVRLVGDLAPVEWSDEIAGLCPRDVAEITIGQINQYPDHKSVSVDIAYGCTSYDHLTVDIQ
jgi:hypothetical protein